MSESTRRAQRRAQASNEALKCIVELLSKPRLWTGKSEVISSAVAIAAKWTGALVDADLDTRVVLGWEGKGAEQCPWLPILVCPGQNQEDLFAGDGWFSDNHDDEMKVDSEVAESEKDVMEVDSGAEGRLDFEGCDALPDNEEEEAGGSASEASALPTVEQGKLTFAGVAFFLLDQALPPKEHPDSDEVLPYRVAAFRGLRNLMAGLPEASTTGAEQKKTLYMKISPELTSLCDVDAKQSKEPPVVVARAIDCLAECFWQDMGSKDDTEESVTTDILELANLLRTAGGEKQPAWTVREASRLALVSLTSNCHHGVLKDHKLISCIVECAAGAQKDRKFWKVRLSGLKLLRALVARAGTRAIGSVTDNMEEQERQLLLEAILPQKESIMKLARKSLTDPEAKVTALGSDILGLMSWWP